MNTTFDSQNTLLKTLRSLFQRIAYHSIPNRPPRLTFLGRRGAGKTTLLNAIFGKRIGESSAVQPGNTDSTWKSYQTPDGKRIEILDTRGFQTADPTNGIDSSYLQTTIQALQSKQPDIFLFLIKAKEVNSAIKVDLDALATLLQGTYQSHQAYPAVVVVVTQCDELDPPYINLAQDKNQHPQEWEEKIRNVRVAVQVIREHFEQRTEIYSHVVDIIPIAAFIRIRADGTIDPDPRLDHRWNIDLVAQTIVEKIPFVAKVSFARLASMKKHQESFAKSVILMSTGAAIAANATSRRSIGSAFIASIQLLMSYGIAYIFGYDVSGKNKLDLVTSLGFGLGTSLTTGKVNSLIGRQYPRHNKLMSGIITALSTMALGLALLRYLSRGSE